MSSFVVDKSEFIKAAGLLYGIEAAKGVHAHKWFLDNVRERFVECYELNAQSVDEQYNEISAIDTESYDDVFKQYGQIGLEIGFGTCKKIDLKSLRIKMWMFFNSVLYQTESEEAHDKISSWFLVCLTKLFHKEIYNVEGWWGEIEL